jgi:hypothetical protein
MNTIERKKKEAERKRKARLLESDEQIRIRRQARQIEIANTRHRLLLKSEKEHKKTMQIEVANTGTIHIIIYIQYILSN